MQRLMDGHFVQSQTGSSFCFTHIGRNLLVIEKISPVVVFILVSLVIDVFIGKVRIC